MIRIGQLPSNYGPASALGAAVGALSGVLSSKVLCQLPLPFVIQDWDQQLTGWLSLRLHAMNPVFFADIATRYQYFLDNAGVPAWQITGRFDAAAVIGLGVGVAVTWLIGRSQPDTKIIAGRRLFENQQVLRELAKICKKESAVSGEGLKLHPSFNFHLSRDREVRHALFLGSPGGGKTQLLTPVILAAIARGDKVLIFDVKGDFTSTLPGDFILLAPWDQRSAVWNVAADCLNKQDARELASQLIEEGKDPMWHQAARQILAAIIRQLQVEKPKAWTWEDLHVRAASSQEELLKIVKQYAPEAVNLVSGESKTTEGILINLSSSMSIVADLADAWGKSDPNRHFSISDWLLNPSPKHKTVVMQGSGRYAELTRGYVRGMVSLLTGRVNSAEFSDDKSRRVVVALDEFPQLCVGGASIGHKVSSLIEIGRSKGLTLFIGAQDLSQIKESLGPYVASTWGSMIGTQFICRVNPGETAQWISKEVIGYAKIEKTIMHEGKPQPAQMHEQLVMEPSELSDYLGPHKKGVKAALLGYGDVFLLDWPYTTLPKIREPIVSATWTLSPTSPPTGGGKIQQQKGDATMNQDDQTETKKPRLILRAPTQADMLDMAKTGTDLRDAAEPWSEMTATPKPEDEQ